MRRPRAAVALLSSRDPAPVKAITEGLSPATLQAGLAKLFGATVMCTRALGVGRYQTDLASSGLQTAAAMKVNSRVARPLGAACFGTKRGDAFKATGSLRRSSVLGLNDADASFVGANSEPNAS